MSIPSISIFNKVPYMVNNFLKNQIISTFFRIKVSLPFHNQRHMKGFKHIAIVLFSILCLQGMAQDYNIGVRAGLNYSKFQGPSEEGVTEKFSLASGFHFGFSFTYNLNEFLGLRTELAYNQAGSKYKYEGDSYYIFRNSERVPTPTQIVYDSSRFNLDVSNAYFSIPLTLHLRTLEKFEFYGGGYVNFLISSIGAGNLRFGSDEFPQHTFTQGNNHNYKSDVAGGVGQGAGQVLVLANGVRKPEYSQVGAYYFQTTKEGNLYKSVDYGLIAGVAYYLNPGLYFGLRANFGLRDITNNLMDISRKELDENDGFILKSDDDRNLDIQLSIGFKF